jgi:hypothetical protein
MLGEVKKGCNGVVGKTEGNAELRRPVQRMAEKDDMELCETKCLSVDVIHMGHHVIP